VCPRKTGVPGDFQPQSDLRGSGPDFGVGIYFRFCADYLMKIWCYRFQYVVFLKTLFGEKTTFLDFLGPSRRYPMVFETFSDPVRAHRIFLLDVRCGLDLG
jgi:hypothetical protein